MPITSTVILFSVMAIATMPFFNGFISEWLIYQAVMKGIQINAVNLRFILPMVLMVIAMVTGFAFVAFSKLYAIAFLGYPRFNKTGLTQPSHGTSALSLDQGVCEGATGVYSSVNEDSEQANNAELSQVRKSCKSQNAKEVSFMMYSPGILLSLLCLGLGLYPQILNTVWSSILNQFALSLPNDLPYFAGPAFPTAFLICAGVIVLGILGVISASLKSKHRKAIPWTCGYQVDERMQYTASSYSQPIMRLLKDFYRINFSHIFIDLYFRFYNTCKSIRDYVHSGDLHKYLLYLLISIIGGLIYAKYS